MISSEEMVIWAADASSSWAGVDSTNLQKMAPTGIVVKTGMTEGKDKFSQVLSNQKGSEIGTASGVTSHRVPPDGS
jgi:hypothetical protein